MTTSPSSSIEACDLIERLATSRPPRLVDVRTPSEFSTAHIPGSYNLPLDLLQEHRDELVRHLEDVVLICWSSRPAGSGS